MDKYFKKFDSVEVESNVKIDAVYVKRTDNNIDVHEVKIKWDKDTTNDKSYASIKILLPMRRSKFRWAPYCQLDKAMRSTWMGTAKFNTMLAVDCPVTCVYDVDDCNEYTVALSDVKRNIEIFSGYEENGAMFAFRGVVMLCELGTLDSYTFKVRVDRNNEYIGKTLDRTRKWWEEILNIEPMNVPEEAKLPMYSTWYSYHQDITDESIEKEARLAAVHQTALNYLRGVNKVKWTYISPAADFQADGERTGKYILAGEDFTLNVKGESIISYADYAITMVDEIEKGSHICERISVVKE